jgi:hypothetical protein
MKINEVSCSVRKRMKKSVPMAKLPIASSVEVLPSKGSLWINVVCIILILKVIYIKYFEIQSVKAKK